MKYLFIAEKPSLMRDVKKCYENHRSEVNDKVGQIDFTALAGHACCYYEPNEYAEWDGKWEDIQYPMIPRPFQIKPIGNKANMVKEIGQKVRTYDGVIVGTDSDTEGYGIYYLLESYLGIREMKALRFMEHSLTDKEILQSLLSMTDYHTDPVHVRFTQAFVLRAVADWLYGMNATRVATVHTGELLTIGRVKAPTLKLVYDNSAAIANFKPETYFHLTADYGAFTAVQIGADGKPVKYKTAQHGQTLDDSGVVSSREDKLVETHAPKLYDLPSLQMDAGQMLGLSPKETLETVQSLYEKHKAVSYPRTQCRYVSSEKAKEFPDMLEKVAAFPDLKPLTAGLTTISQIMKDKRVVNDAEVAKESHDALLPTSKMPDLSAMNERETKVLRLIFLRFLAQFLPQLKESKTQLVLRHGECQFLANGKIVVEPGWRGLYGKSKEAELPNLQQGEPVTAQTFKMEKQVTRPPKRLTQAALISAMENIANKVEDPELRASLANSKGIGTPATRDTIIADLLARGYVEDRKGLYITDKGSAYIESLQDVDIISPVFAARMDCEIKKIQRGEADFKEVYKTMLVNLKDTCRQLETLQRRKTTIVCKNCGKPLEDERWEYTCPECGFKLPKYLCGVAVTEEMLKDLYAGKKSPVYTFRKKDGTTFKSGLILSEKGLEFASCIPVSVLRRGGAHEPRRCVLRLRDAGIPESKRKGIVGQGFDDSRYQKEAVKAERLQAEGRNGI